ncbi:elongation factor-1 alpha [Culex quinquefasciatus]|uniref:Elongation factor-1 alpha n=1 Tax=Culex quinquefasciatus TaxID=7176 RepID=B0WE83_CULQU|nr:elongation factor-1 alpha [Culex quinquefasciatus]|eukprot:XP_001847017.1 elongation factor-1 alpha [Culex quinquefasciatus]
MSVIELCWNRLAESGAGHDGSGHETRENTLGIAFTFGIKQLIVDVNKMDSTEPTYNQDIKKKVSSYIKKIDNIPVAVTISLHLPLKDVNKIGGTGTETVYAPVNLTTDCKYVEMCQEALPEAVPRNNAKNLFFKELRRGYVADDLNISPPMLDCHNTQIACEFSEIKEKIFRRSDKSRELWPESLDRSWHHVMTGISGHALAAGGLSGSKGASTSKP